MHIPKTTVMINLNIEFLAVSFVPLIYVSLFMPVPCCFDYCSFAVMSEVWKDFAPIFVLFPQNCFGNSGSLDSVSILRLFVLVL